MGDQGIVVLFGTVSSGFLIFCLTRGLRMRDDKRPLSTELFWYAGGLLPLAGTCLLWASLGDQMLLAQRIACIVIGAGVGGFGLFALGEALRPQAKIVAQAQSPVSAPPVVSNSIGSVTGNVGVLQQGLNNVVVQKPPARMIDNELRGLIKAHLQDKAKEIAIMVLTGDDEPERTAFANQIAEFMKAEGYTVRPIRYFLTGGGTPQGIEIITEQDPQAIIIRIGVNNRT